MTSRSLRRNLPRMLSRDLPRGYVYYNVGHSNLTRATLAAVAHSGGRTSVLIHDTIPLDFPALQRANTVDAFRRKLSAASDASRIICSTQAAGADLARHLPDAPPVITAPLGIEVQRPQGPVPSDLPSAPFVLCLGTIEPRKNHALLLDLWADWPDAPELVIAGRRGWKNEDVFAQLDQGVAKVTERQDISDDALPHWIAQARALVLPSLAEGYGLPPAEALALGTPVVVSHLPAMKEVLGAHAVYADPHDRYQWKNKILALVQNGHGSAASFVAPTWDAHFKAVFTDGW